MRAPREPHAAIEAGRGGVLVVAAAAQSSGERRVTPLPGWMRRKPALMAFPVVVAMRYAHKGRRSSRPRLSTPLEPNGVIPVRPWARRTHTRPPADFPRGHQTRQQRRALQGPSRADHQTIVLGRSHQPHSAMRRSKSGAGPTTTLFSDRRNARAEPCCCSSSSATQLEGVTVPGWRQGAVVPTQALHGLRVRISLRARPFDMQTEGKRWCGDFHFDLARIAQRPVSQHDCADERKCEEDQHAERDPEDRVGSHSFTSVTSSSPASPPSVGNRCGFRQRNSRRPIVRAPSTPTRSARPPGSRRRSSTPPALVPDPAARAAAAPVAVQAELRLAGLEVSSSRC